MIDSTYVSANSRAAILERIAAGRTGWLATLVLLVGRPLCWLVAQAVTAAVFLVQGHPDPWSAAAPWWSVYAVLANLMCLAIVVVFVRREGITLADLFGRIRLAWGLDLWLAIGAYVVFVSTMLIPAPWINHLMFGVDYPTMYPGLLAARELPVWAVAVSFLVFVPLNPIVEQATYQGYVLARLDALLKRRWIAPLLVGFFWSLQHSLLPFIPEWRYVIWRFLYFFLGTLAFTVLYLLIRRLPPLIAPHWAMDGLAVFYTLRF